MQSTGNTKDVGTLISMWVQEGSETEWWNHTHKDSWTVPYQLNTLWPQLLTVMLPAVSPNERKTYIHKDLHTNVKIVLI